MEIEQYVDLELSRISQPDFENYKQHIIDILIPHIWDYSDSDINEAKDCVLEYYQEGGTGTYYYITLGGEKIGITGYYEIALEAGIFGLRHHGILPEYRNKGIGRAALKLLLEEIDNKYKGITTVKGIVELVPKGNNFIENIFFKMGFVQADKSIIEHPKIKEQLEDGYYEKVYILKLDS